MITGILLAAGKGSRFGSQKLLAQLADGRCVVESAAATLLKNVERVIAVVAGEGDVADLLRRAGCEIVINQRAAEGMGTSIATGVAASPDASGWLVVLGDMPYLQAGTIAQVRDMLVRERGIVIPTCQTRRGHPVGFHRAYRGELMALIGDEGARTVVAAHAQAVRLLATDDTGVLADIDWPDDIRRA